MGILRGKEQREKGRCPVLFNLKNIFVKAPLSTFVSVSLLGTVTVSHGHQQLQWS